METIEIIPQRTCSRKIVVTIDNNIIQEVIFNGGCPGNTLGVAALLKGMKVEEAISKLDGIMCGVRGTSCPNELAKALKSYLQR